jgi:hypothetical protein
MLESELKTVLHLLIDEGLVGRPECLTDTPPVGAIGLHYHGHCIDLLIYLLEVETDILPPGFPSLRFEDARPCEVDG